MFEKLCLADATIWFTEKCQQYVQFVLHSSS